MALVKDILRTMDYGPSPESSDHVRAWLGRHEDGFGHFIAGRFGEPGGLFDVFDPATGERIARASRGAPAEVDAAVAAAREAAPKWAALSGHERARFLYALARHVQKRERFLAVLETIDAGKPIRESRDVDVPLVARHFYHHAGWASLIESAFPDTRAAGVCGQILPWNSPLLMLAWKVAPALAAGCTVVLKPAEYTPLTALAFAEICVEAGLPAGVVNIVTGDGDTGAALVAHDGVDAIAFTGSTAAGRAIRKATAGTGKTLTLDLGGKSPFVVFDDADLDSAVEGVVDAMGCDQGHVSRLLAAEGIADALHAKLRARMANLRVGDPLDKSTDLGAIVAPDLLDRIERLMRAGAEEGLDIWRAGDSVPARGWFYPPTLVTGVAPASLLMREEIFGPVLVTTTFRTPDEAIALANNTRAGLAASIWTENAGRAFEVAARLEAGVVWINSVNLFDAASSFGGWRESGFGREGGKEGLFAYRVTDAPSGKPYPAKAPALAALPGTLPAGEGAAGIDRTAKLFVGGRQARPDSGASYGVLDPQGREVGLAASGSRKDIRNAVEAAAKAAAWASATAHNRAQVLYYVAENLSARAEEFAARLTAMTGASAGAAAAEVDASIRRIFFYAGFADKLDGAVPATRAKCLTLAVNEPWGVMGIVCPDEAPLLGFVSLVMPAIAMGNCIVAVPSARHPLGATDFYSVLDTSDVPAGAVNIVTGEANGLALTLAEHDGVDAVWYVGGAAGAAKVEAASAGNLKATWTQTTQVDWPRAEGREFLRRATRVKAIWTPYGE